MGRPHVDCFIRIAAVATLLCTWAGTADAVLPHEGNYSQKQMAGIALGYFAADQMSTCPTIGSAVGNVVAKLTDRYGFEQDDIVEDSKFGRRYVAMGREIAAKDSRAATFSADVQSELDEDSVELLPH